MSYFCLLERKQEDKLVILFLITIHDARNMSNAFITDFIIWLAPWADKMNQIARSDWLPEQEGAVLSARNYPSCPAWKISSKAKP